MDTGLLEYFVPAKTTKLIICSISGVIIGRTHNHLNHDFIAKLKDAEAAGYDILLLDNMLGYSLDALSDFIEKVKLELPASILIARKKNMFKLPCTNIFNHYLEATGARPTTIIMIGKNAGRYAHRQYRSDTSDVHRAFAENIKATTFFTPEQFFYEDFSMRKWGWRGVHVSALEVHEDTPIPANYNIYIINGPLCSGKKNLAVQIARLFKRATAGATYKIYANIDNETLLNHPPGVVAIIFGTFAEEFIIDLLAGIDVNTVLFIKIIIPLKTCYFLNKVKLQITKNINLIEHSEFAIYNSFKVIDYEPKLPLLLYKFPLKTKTESHFRY